MNAIQLALRTAAHARDYNEIDRLIVGGATSADLLRAVLSDIARTGDVLLFEIMLCSAPLEYDFSAAREIEKDVRSGRSGVADGEVIAMHIRGVLWRRLLIDEMIPFMDMLIERQAALRYADASMYLSGYKASPGGAAIHQRWARGEITMDECIADIKRIHEK